MAHDEPVPPADDPATTPGAVRAAVALMVVGAALAVAGAAAQTAGDGPDDRGFVAAVRGWTAVEVVLWLGLALASARRHPWARELGTVLGGVNIALTVLVVETSLVLADITMSTGDAAMAVAGAAVAAAVLWCLHRPEVGRWLAEPPPQPQPQPGPTTPSG